MPTYSDIRKGQVLTSKITYSDGRPQVLSYQDIVLYEDEISKPTTLKRPKPLEKDLLRLGTARTVVSRRWTSSPTVSSRRNDGVIQEISVYPTSFVVPHLTDPLPYTPNVNELLQPLLLRVKDEKVNLSVSLPELGKTTDMVFELARDIRYALRSLRSGFALGNLVAELQKPSTRNGKKAAKRWLEYIYGWVPTLSDVYGLSELMGQKLIDGYYPHARVSRSFTDSSAYKLDYNRVSVNRNLDGKMGLKCTYRVDSEGLRLLSQSGFTNPLLTAWELVPYSFVVDQVVGIGDYLASLDALVGISDFYSQGSFGYTAHYRADHTYSSFGTVSTPGQSMGMYRVSKRYAPASRTPLRPRYEPSLSTTQMLTATALLRNLK